MTSRFTSTLVFAEPGSLSFRGVARSPGVQQDACAIGARTRSRHIRISIHASEQAFWVPARSSRP